jgi:hypothetical protein
MDGPEYTADDGICECGGLKRFVDDKCNHCSGVSPMTPPARSPADALRNIRLAAARGASFGHQVTQQPLALMVEKKDKALRDILRYCAEAGYEGSVLRESSHD